MKDGGEIDAEEIVKFSCRHTNWDNIKYDLDEKIIPFLRSRGATKFGTIGTCWGGYNIIRFLILLISPRKTDILNKNRYFRTRY